jgi:tRNA(fMet)-specific endonuclease VapC
MRFMLDTNICIHVVTGKPAASRRFAVHAGSIATSAIVLSELRYGVAKSARPAANRAALEAFLALVQVIEYGAEAARDFGDLKQHLYALGTPIGPFDMLIAAHARSLGMTLVTNNRGEFDRVPGLRVEDWATA